jgi:hypothetical protein
MEKKLKNTKLTLQTIKNTPLLWAIFLLVMPVLQVIHFYPFMWLRNLLTLYIPNIRLVALAFSKIIAVAIIFSISFTVIILIVKKVFWRIHALFSIKSCFKIFTSILIILLPLNFGVEVLRYLTRGSGLASYFINYTIIIIKCTIFYYILHSWMDDGINTKQKFLARLKNSFSRQIIFNLLLVTLSICIITTPFYYYFFIKFSESLQQNFSSGLFLALTTQYHNPLWYTILSLFLTSLIHAFLIIYTAVLYNEQRNGNDFK